MLLLSAYCYEYEATSTKMCALGLQRVVYLLEYTSLFLNLRYNRR